MYTPPQAPLSRRSLVHALLHPYSGEVTLERSADPVIGFTMRRDRSGQDSLFQAWSREGLFHFKPQLRSETLVRGQSDAVGGGIFPMCRWCWSPSWSSDLEADFSPGWPLLTFVPPQGIDWVREQPNFCQTRVAELTRTSPWQLEVKISHSGYSGADSSFSRHAL